MPRKRQIVITPSDVLRGIIRVLDASLTNATTVVAEYDRAVAAGERLPAMFTADHPHHWLRDLQEHGVVYDVEDFLGRHPTTTERAYCQRSIKQLADDGLIEVTGRRITVTPAGRAKLQEIAAHA